MLQQPRSTVTTRRAPPQATTFLEGLWVLLVRNEGEIDVSDADGRVPLLALAGNNKTYLLGWKNAVKARQFAATSELEGAEARMVVKGNKDEVLRIVRSAGVAGLLVDFDATTKQYAADVDLPSVV
jgi:hypothetical protein